MLYNDKVRELFLSPKNLGEISNADGIGEVGNAKCGDIMKIWIKVVDNKITKCMWKTFGCASAIASTSILSEMVIGMTLDEAYSIKAKDILDKLGGLPAKKVHCSVLGDQALKKAIDNYRNSVS